MTADCRSGVTDGLKLLAQCIHSMYIHEGECPSYLGRHRLPVLRRMTSPGNVRFE